MTFGEPIFLDYIWYFLIEFYSVRTLSALQARVDAVDEIMSSDEPGVSERLLKLRETLKGLPDLAKGICRIQYGKVRF